jgi:hypothetical protein
MGEQHRYEVHAIAGTGCIERLVATALPLPEPAAEIVELRKTVLVDQAEVVLEAVLLQGRIHILVLFMKGGVTSALRDASGEIGMVSCGPLLVLKAEVRFLVQVRVPGARPGLTCRVKEAFISADGSRVQQVNEQGLVLTLLDQSVIYLRCVVLAPPEYRTAVNPRPPRIISSVRPPPIQRPTR